MHQENEEEKEEFQDKKDFLLHLILFWRLKAVVLLIFNIIKSIIINQQNIVWKTISRLTLLFRTPELNINLNSINLIDT